MKILKSKTVWSAIATAAFNILPVIHDAVPAGAQVPINIILMALTTLFRVKPTQDFHTN